MNTKVTAAAAAPTPGPWAWSAAHKTLDGRATWSLIGADGYGILSCDGEENSPQGIHDGANADLIVAAPDLRDANAALVDALNVAFGITSDHDDDYIYDALPTSGVATAYFAARAALAKAGA